MKFVTKELRERRFRELSGCIGVKMLDGTVYNTNRKGEIEIDNQRHIKELKNDKQLADLVNQKAYSFVAKENNCNCGFTAFSWQTTCPKCGNSLNERK